MMWCAHAYHLEEKFGRGLVQIQGGSGAAAIGRGFLRSILCNKE